jgi:general secretion pathway protein D
LGQTLHVLILLAAPAHLDLVPGSGTVVVRISRQAESEPNNASPKPIVLGETTSVVRLRFADVSEIVGVLVQGQNVSSNDIFTPQPSQLSQSVSTIGTSTTSVASPSIASTMATSSQSQSLGQKITDEISVDRRLNAVVLTGTTARVQELRRIIQELDVPLPSVTLETQIVELTDNDAKQIGIDFTNGGGPIASASSSLKSQGFASSSLALQAQLYDLVTKGSGKLIARPSIVAQSGASASILTGDEIPIVTTLTSYGSATLAQQQVQYVTVGVNLQIQPRISDDGFISFHVYSEVSSVSAYVQGFPEITQRTAATAATVRDGQPFVIGGLIETSEIKSLSKIPILGDLPVLGSLFRNRSDQRATTNLYIIVTPHITPPKVPNSTEQQ